MSFTLNRIVISAACVICLYAGSASSQACNMDSTISPGRVRIPAKINPGKKYSVAVTVTNSGTCTWETSGRIRLSIKIVRGPSGSGTQRDELTPIVELKYKVPPSRSHTFHYDIEGPNYLGRYTIEWILVTQNRPFGNEVRKTIEVVQPK